MGDGCTGKCRHTAAPHRSLYDEPLFVMSLIAIFFLLTCSLCCGMGFAMYTVLHGDQLRNNAGSTRSCAPVESAASQQNDGQVAQGKPFGVWYKAQAGVTEEQTVV